MTSDAAAVVREFWRLMEGNDFYAVAAVLAPGFVLEWPQSNERIRGAENFAALNAEYPASGPWRFTVNRVFGTESDAVSDVSITDGVQKARAISFFTVIDGKIAQMTEYWPEPYDPPPSRRHLTEPLTL
jgi:ketosteroid isomerase-like protein